MKLVDIEKIQDCVRMKVFQIKDSKSQYDYKKPAFFSNKCSSLETVCCICIQAMPFPRGYYKFKFHQAPETQISLDL